MDKNKKNDPDYEFEKHLKKLKLVRGEFKTVGKYDMPIIKKQDIDLDKIELWNFTKTKVEDKENKHKTIHFFTYDWEFNSVYEKPDIGGIMNNSINKEKKGNINPQKCRVCGLCIIENDFYICPYCGWEADPLQEDEPDYMGGANQMSLNQYKQFWEENKDEILKANNPCFKSIDCAKKYYFKHYKKN